MDYAIYKTHDGQYPRVIHRFTQAQHDHRAKRAAMQKLHEMWLRVRSRPELFRNAMASDTDFSYDHPTSAHTHERIHFYIARL